MRETKQMGVFQRPAKSSWGKPWPWKLKPRIQERNTGNLREIYAKYIKDELQATVDSEITAKLKTTADEISKQPNRPSGKRLNDYPPS